MKQCPKCHQKHSKSGTFCSRTCANSRQFSENSLRLKSKSQIKALANKTPTARKAMMQKANEVRLKNCDERRHTLDTTLLSHGALRRRIIEEQQGKCLDCNIDKWRDKPITLELDHIDGVNTNNNRDNLRALCPNCHSQTPTWRGRNNKRACS